MVTLDANFVRKVVSSIALSPPPTTYTFLSLKKKASQVAHAETPYPINFLSDSRPSNFADAPVDIIIDFDENICSPAYTLNSELEKQVIGRAYRLGRTGPLKVHKLYYINEM